MPQIAPALDAVIERFGTDAVAEVTGRTKRLVRLPDGSQKLQSRSPSACMADADAFMNGAKRILVFSDARSEEHTSELQSLMRISYAVFCLKKKKIQRSKISELKTRHDRKQQYRILQPK